MERLSVAEVSNLLCAHGFPEVLIRDFGGKNTYIPDCNTSEMDIDRATLVAACGLGYSIF